MAVEGRADRVDLGVERQARRADRAEVHEEDPAVREEVAPRAERLGADAVLGLERRASGRDLREAIQLGARGRGPRAAIARSASSSTRAAARVANAAPDSTTTAGAARAAADRRTLRDGSSGSLGGSLMIASRSRDVSYEFEDPSLE